MDNDSAGRITAGLRVWIADARPGQQLPTTRELVSQYSASPVTVQKALRTLSAAGLIETRVGVGAFVKPQVPARSADYQWQDAAMPDLPSSTTPQSSALRSVPADAATLHAGYPDRQLLPTRLVAGAFARAARGASTLSRPPSGGLPELQEWFAGELAQWVPAGLPAPTARDVLVLPGSQSGLSSIFRALAGPGGKVLCETPTYWGAILAARQAGVELVPVASRPTGPDPEDVDRAFAQTGARVFYAQPTFANPTGVQWDATTGRNVLDIVRAHRAFLVEDDWAHDFVMTGRAEPLSGRDPAGHTVYLRSLTKSVSPSVRIAALVARGPARDRLLADAEAQVMYVSGFLQTVALDVVTQTAWRTHLRWLRGQLLERRDHLLHALSEHTPTARVESVPAGGLNVWLRLPTGTDIRELVAACERQRVIVAAGDEWFPAEPTGPYLRLNFAGPDPDRFDDCAVVIGAALEAQR